MRGIFSHRQVTLIDQSTGENYTPLKQILDEKHQNLLTIANSPLSRYGVLGFEYGYSLASPKCLIICEAQFGDVGNGAQVTIDHFIISGEKKWESLSA